MTKIRRYINDDDKVGVIVSHGYGAGWSSWQNNDAEFLLFDKSLIELVIDNRLAEIPKYLASQGIKLPASDLDQLNVEFINQDSYVSISCSDGFERLETYEHEPENIVSYKVQS